MTSHPGTERGFFHLLSDGWHRGDKMPFPEDRLETWACEMEQPAEDAKERINSCQPTHCRDILLGTGMG
jgi:hypothetical protein